MEIITKMFANASPVVYITIGLFVVLFIALAIGLFSHKGKPKTQKLPKHKPKSPGIESDTEEEEVQSILGTGNIKCACLRKPNIIDFTTIPEPIGDVIEYDTTLLIKGRGYLIKELANGKFEAVSPNDISVIADQMPDYAYDALDWKEDVDNFWIVPVLWWKNGATWFAAAMIAVVFILGLVVFE